MLSFIVPQEVSISRSYLHPISLVGGSEFWQDILVFHFKAWSLSAMTLTLIPQPCAGLTPECMRRVLPYFGVDFS